MEKLLKITSWIGVAIILIMVGLSIKAYINKCKDCDVELYNVIIKEMGCQEKLEHFKNGSLIFEDDDVRVIRFDKIKEEIK